MKLILFNFRRDRVIEVFMILEAVRDVYIERCFQKKFLHPHSGSTNDHRVEYFAEPMDGCVNGSVIERGSGCLNQSVNAVHF